MKYFDITPVISESMAVFPGDMPFSREVVLDYKKGDNLLLSFTKGSLHLGAHADASNHYNVNGQGIDKRPLEPYFGKCQVIEVKIPRDQRIQISDFKVAIQAPRVLFKTNSFPDPNIWNSDFNSLSPELVDFLAKNKVKLVGIDTPSVDPEQSKHLESHQAIYKNDLCILEGLVLTHVPDGIYTLVALPIPILGADAAPVRAILIQDF